VRLRTKLIDIFDDREIVSGPLVFLITGNSSTISYLHEAGNENVSLELSNKTESTCNTEMFKKLLLPRLPRGDNSRLTFSFPASCR
jgi:hypothetical protein